MSGALDELEEIVRRHVTRPDLDAALALLEQERGLRAVQADLLVALRQRGPCLAREVAAVTGRDVSTTGRWLNELERRGLAARATRFVGANVKASHIRWWITPAGAASVADLVPT